MKKCPLCNSVYEDGDDFCPQDGGTLVGIGSLHQSQPSANDLPTVFDSGFSPQAPRLPNDPGAGTKWVFPVLGILLGIIVVLGFLVYSSQNSETGSGNEAAKDGNSNGRGDKTVPAEPIRTDEPARPPVQTESRPVEHPGAKVAGSYPQGSLRILTIDDLSGKSTWELRIMRNEIFARHGYIFKSPQLRSYFMTKEWYQPSYGDVSGFLSGIEKRNALFLKSYE